MVVIKIPTSVNCDVQCRGLPGGQHLIAATDFGRFDLDEAKHARIRAELDARARARETAKPAAG